MRPVPTGHRMRGLLRRPRTGVPPGHRTATFYGAPAPEPDRIPWRERFAKIGVTQSSPGGE